MSAAWFGGILDTVLGARKIVGAVLITAGLCLPLGYCKGEQAANARHEAARALANTKALQIDAAAGESAAEERVQDALRVERLEEDLLDAISDTPDTAPDLVRVQLGCQRLREQGTAPADLPAVCGPRR
jgi:hypothetical protein